MISLELECYNPIYTFDIREYPHVNMTLICLGANYSESEDMFSQLTCAYFCTYLHVFTLIIARIIARIFACIFGGIFGGIFRRVVASSHLDT